MKISTRETKVDLTNPNIELKSATIGVITVESPEIYSAFGEMVSLVFPYKPYSERLFSFRLVNGTSLSNEQIFSSVYSVQASRAFIETIIDEREPVMAKWVDIVQTFVRAKEASVLKSEDRSKSRQSIFTDGLDNFLNTHLEHTDLLSQLRSKLELAKEMYDKSVCDLEDILLLYDGVTADDLDTTDQIPNFIPGAHGGGYLGRSPQKVPPFGNMLPPI